MIDQVLQQAATKYLGSINLTRPIEQGKPVPGMAERRTMLELLNGAKVAANGGSQKAAIESFDRAAECMCDHGDDESGYRPQVMDERTLTAPANSTGLAIPAATPFLATLFGATGLNIAAAGWQALPKATFSSEIDGRHLYAVYPEVAELTVTDSTGAALPEHLSHRFRALVEANLYFQVQTAGGSTGNKTKPIPFRHATGGYVLPISRAKAAKVGEGFGVRVGPAALFGESGLNQQDLAYPLALIASCKIAIGGVFLSADELALLGGKKFSP